MTLRIFISYKRDVEPDEGLAHRLWEELSKSWEVFRDVETFPGEEWAERIEEELQKADVFIVLISAESVDRDWVVQEVKTAYEFREEKDSPLILWVRVDYSQKLPKPMSVYLDKLQGLTWSGHEDTSELLASLDDVLRKHAEAQKIQKFREDSGLRPLHQLVDRTLQVSKTDAYVADFYRAIGEVLRLMGARVAEGQPLEELQAQAISGELVPEDLEEQRPAVKRFIEKNAGSIERPNLEIPVVLAVMDSGQAEELFSGEALVGCDEHALLAFRAAQERLAAAGFDQWQAHYGGYPRLWRPFSGTETIEKIVRHGLESIGDSPRPIQPDFIDLRRIRHISRSRLEQLRRDGCLVVIDAVSMHHPEIQKLFRESLLDVFTETVVAKVAPSSEMLEISVRRAQPADHPIDREFHLRLAAKDPACGQIVSDALDLSAFFQKRTARLWAGQKQTGVRKYMFGTGEPVT